jgi:hypothetical protein
VNAFLHLIEGLGGLADFGRTANAHRWRPDVHAQPMGCARKCHDRLGEIGHYQSRQDSDGKQHHEDRKGEAE